MTTNERNIQMTLKNEKHTCKQVWLRCFVFYLITLAVALGALLPKLFFLDDRTGLEFDAFSAIGVSAFIAAILIGVYKFIFSLRNSVILSVKVMAATCSVICFCYVFCLYISVYDLYVMPVILCAILLASLVDAKIGFVANAGVVLMLFVSVSVGRNPVIHDDIISFITLIASAVLGSALIVFRLSRSPKRIVNIVTLIIVGAVMIIPVALAGFLYTAESGMRIWRTLGMSGIGLAVQILLTLLLQPMMESIFNLVTNSRLIELSDFRQPLLKRLQDEAPGTFNHSLTLANLAETCATAIGENPYMARAAALYHDVGKLKSPQYFTENQPQDYNPHDELMPEVSRSIIVGHTYSGYTFCMEYRIPEEIANITIEHHGTLPIAVIFNKAKQMTDGDVDITDYRYNGTTPLTKIGAIIMICDACEAAIRSIAKPSGEKVDGIVNMLISYRLNGGQFDNCGITIRDLHTIRKTITEAFGGLYHKRISYDDKKG